MPAVFILAGTWMTWQGLLKQTRISLIAIATILAGALVYHFRIKGQARPQA